MQRGVLDKKASRKGEAFSIPQPKRSLGHWRCGDYLLQYNKHPLIMGILNVTPDSFSDGGLFFKDPKAIDHALRLEAEGADIIDIGGESTRPGASPVSLEEEQKRVLPIIDKLVKKIKVPISIDTRKASIAKQAIEAGASIINDVSGFRFDPEIFSVAAQGRTGLVFMHSKGTPQTMQKAPRYRNVVHEIYDYLSEQIARAKASKIALNRIAIDPGIGFGKTVRHNLSILGQLDYLTRLGLPVLIGPSRKSFIGKILDLPSSDRLEGTAAALAIAIFQGARILRVHDVKEAKRVAFVADGIRKETISSWHS